MTSARIRPHVIQLFAGLAVSVWMILSIASAPPAGAHSADLVDQDGVMIANSRVKFVGTPMCSPPFCPYVLATVNWGDGSTHARTEVRGRVEVGGGDMGCGRVMVRMRDANRRTISIRYSSTVCAVPVLGIFHPSTDRYVTRWNDTRVRSVAIYAQRALCSRYCPWTTTGTDVAYRG